jgi:hypothetical protein
LTSLSLHPICCLQTESGTVESLCPRADLLDVRAKSLYYQRPQIVRFQFWSTDAQIASSKSLAVLLFDVLHQHSRQEARWTTCLRYPPAVMDICHRTPLTHLALHIRRHSPCEVPPPNPYAQSSSTRSHSPPSHQSPVAPPPVPAKFASIMNAYPEPPYASRTSPRSGSGSEHALGSARTRGSSSGSAASVER